MNFEEIVRERYIDSFNDEAVIDKIKYRCKKCGRVKGKSKFVRMVGCFYNND